MLIQLLRSEPLEPRLENGKRLHYNFQFVKEEYAMNIGFWLCGVLVIPFVIIGVLFAIFKERAAKFL